MSFFMSYFICNEYMIQICVIKEIFKIRNNFNGENPGRQAVKVQKGYWRRAFPADH